LDYYTELDAVSMSGILQYPESGDLDILSIPLITHNLAGYMCVNNEVDIEDVSSNIKVSSIGSNVICF